jgi:hypothetical protein
MTANAAKVFAIKSATIGGGTAIDGITFMRVSEVAKVVTDPLTMEVNVAHREVKVEIFGLNQKALIAKVSDTAVDVIATVVRDDGTDGTETLNDVQLTDILGPAEIPEKFAGGNLKDSFGIGGFCQGTGNLAAKWVSA